MKVLHVHSGNIFGGVERILIALAGHKTVTPEFEHQFALCFRDRLADELLKAGATIHKLPETRLANPLEVLRVRAELRKLLSAGRFDLAVVHSAWSHTIFAPEIKAAKVPLIFWLHTRGSAETILERCAQLYFPDAILSVSRWVDESARALFPGVPSDVVYSPLAIDREAFARADRNQIRELLGAQSNQVVILQASRMEAWKGHQELLKALAQLNPNPSWQCWIAGGAERPEENDYLLELQTTAASLGLKERVKFLGRRTDVPALLIAADIYCQANLEAEGFSIAFVEAFFAGLPIVTTALGGALEIVDAQCGILVSPGHSKALANALESLIQNETVRRSMGEAGRQRALDRCDPIRQFRALENFFHQVVARHE